MIYFKLGNRILTERLRIRGPILSSPVAFLTFLCDKNLLTKVIFVNGILNSLSRCILEPMNLLSASLSETKMGSLRLELQ